MADGASNGEIGHLIMQDTKSPSQALSSTFLGLSFASIFVPCMNSTQNHVV
jgi:hypothetical protein